MPPALKSNAAAGYQGPVQNRAFEGYRSSKFSRAIVEHFAGRHIKG